MPFVGDRSLVFLNWNGSVDAAQTTAHELGHAYHNTQLAQRTPLQKMLPMALAETASIFCETLVVEEGLGRARRPRAPGAARRRPARRPPRWSSTSARASCSRRRCSPPASGARVGVEQLNELMLAAQAEAYGDGLDQSTAHPYMWAVKPHYYGAHFYNWPYTYGLLFGLGLFARYRDDPAAFRARYDDVLSRCGMATAEELAADVRLRRHRRGVLDGEPRRAARRGSPSTAASPTAEGCCDRLATDPDRDAARRRCWPASRATASTRCGTGCTSSWPTPAEMTNLPKALRARLDCRAAAGAARGHPAGQRRRRHRQAAVGAGRRRRPSSRC